MAFDRTKVVKRVTHLGKEVFIGDLTGCSTTADIMTALDELAASTRAHIGKMRTITDITGVVVDSAVMDYANKLGKEVFHAKTLKTAIVGVTGYKRILLRTYTFFSGMSPMPCDSVAAALDWVVRD